MSRPDFRTVHLEGNFFSRDFLSRLNAPQSDLTHLSPISYGLGEGGKVRESIAQTWNALSARHARFLGDLERLSDSDAATSPTRRDWLLPLLEALGFGRVQSASPLRALDKDYPISHGWNQTPIHLLGARVPLDKRSPGVAGAAQTAPHAMVQELLNRSDAHRWAILSNGRKLRVLRDSANIARQSYVEFDLDAIFQNEDAPAFALLYLLCHASRFEQDGAILEAWQQLARVEGERALDRLRGGVERSISALASGFLAHRDNGALREELRSGSLAPLDVYRETLRVVYRMLFVLVAETKDALLLPPLSEADRKADPAAARARDEARARYEEYFSLSRLKTKAGKRKGDAHFDLWRGLRLSFGLLQNGEENLALPALGGFLFEPLRFDSCEISNRDLLLALRELAWFQSGGTPREVNFNLGSEELGSVYESLLELSPVLDLEARSFELRTLAGNERKTTGSYYTPEILVKSLLESALEPLLERTSKAPDREKALLGLSILDPACGSGHFLTAAARRVARELALVRSGGDEPGLEGSRAAMRDVISRCVYGIDLNPMAVELCKVALWMEALEPGKPLSFLDSHVRCGNALLGATPELLERGIPDEAFAPLEGDDRAVVAALKKRNKIERTGQGTLFDEGLIYLGDLSASLERIESASDGDISDVRRKESEFAKWQTSAPYRHTHLLADAWCAAFVWRRVRDVDMGFIEPLTQSGFVHIRRHALCQFFEQEAEIQRLARSYRWFHPHIEFPLVTKRGGFDLVIGNPPWERIKLQEKEWFALRAPKIANAPNAARRKELIESLETTQPGLWLDFQEARRRAEGESHFVRSSHRFPLCGVGDVNTYALFAEANRDFIGAKGRVGCIVPSGIATDDTTKAFFASICDTHQLASLFDIENKGKAFFPDVHASFKFCLLTLSGAQTPVEAAQFVFFAHSDADLSDTEKRFSLSAQDIALLNPNTKTCPIFRSTQDAELTKAIYRRVPVLVDEAKGKAGNLWEIEIGRMFHTSDDSPSFCAEETETTLRLYEAKCYWHFDHRYATWADEDYREVTEEEKQDPKFLLKFRYNIEHDKIPNKFKRRLRKWFLSFRKITNTTNERTLVTAITPESGLLDSGNNIYTDNAVHAAILNGCLNSLVVDYTARQKVGGSNMTVGLLSQLPVLPPTTYEQTPDWTGGEVLRDWISRRVVELCFTAHDLTAFARDCGWEGEPFEWDTERRFDLRCELDAAFFRLYGLTQGEAAYVLDTFPIVKRKDEAAFGSFRTRERILGLLE